VPPPALDDDLCLAQAVEDLAVEQLIPQPGVEALEEAVLPSTIRRQPPARLRVLAWPYV
jgi:hypothetical protein